MLQGEDGDGAAPPPRPHLFCRPGCRRLATAVMARDPAVAVDTVPDDLFAEPVLPMDQVFVPVECARRPWMRLDTF